MCQILHLIACITFLVLITKVANALDCVDVYDETKTVQCTKKCIRFFHNQAHEKNGKKYQLGDAYQWGCADGYGQAGMCRYDFLSGKNIGAYECFCDTPMCNKERPPCEWILKANKKEINFRICVRNNKASTASGPAPPPKPKFATNQGSSGGNLQPQSSSSSTSSTSSSSTTVQSSGQCCSKQKASLLELRTLLMVFFELLGGCAE